MRMHALLMSLAGLILTAAVVAQSPALSEAQRARSNGPRELFERARLLEESNTSLREAVRLYGQVASQAVDRQLAATAHLRIGLLHERLGQKDDAVKAFTTVARDFADQRQIADRARARLAALPGARATPASTASRLVWSGPAVDTQGSLSPDGRYISYAERGSGHLAVYNLTTGKSTRLTQDNAGGAHMAMESRISPDSRQVAFAWSKGVGVAELRIAQIGRLGSRVIYSNPEFVPDPFGWSPDGGHIFAVLEGRTGTIQIAAVPLTGSGARVLKSFDWRFPDASVSPDGRWIVYAVRPGDGNVKGDLFLLAVDGSRETPLDRHPADDGAAIWAPDGSGVVFVSDRGGALDLWFMPVADGEPRGPARMVKQNVGRGRPLGFTADGRLFYGSGKQSIDVYVGSIDPASSRATAAIAPVSERFVGSNYAPDWSPDGTRLLYTSQRNTVAGGGAGKTIVVRSMSDGREHELTPKLQYFHRPRWAPDGRTIVAQGKGLTGPAALFAIDADTGSLEAIVRGGEGFPAQQSWTRDGRTLFFSFSDATVSRIVARDVRSGVEREIHRPSGGEKAVSPDGKWLAVQFHEVGKPPYIRLISTTGPATRVLVSIDAPDGLQYFGGLSWTPDGKGVLFVKQSGERGELHHVDVETGRIRPTGLAPPGLRYVRLHPDGRQLAYSAGTRQDEVWVIENFLSSATAAAAGRRQAGR